jgi:hypothetical protein
VTNNRIVSLPPVTSAFLPMNGAEFSKGDRIDLASTASECSFRVELQAMAGPGGSVP